MKRAGGPDPNEMHGRTGTYTAGCRCDECRAANTARQRRYRAGERRQPARHRQIEIAAQRVLDVIMDNHDGWSIFDSEMIGEAQEAVVKLADALRRDTLPDTANR